MEDNAEQNWVEGAKRGEPTAIAELYRRYWRAARAAAYGVTGDLGLAEDAASEAFFAAFDSLQNLREIQRFGPWLHTIVVRTARRLKASHLREKEVELQTLPDAQSPVPSANLEQRELIALIHEAVGNLSKTLREAMFLFYFEGYSLKEAACFLDVPIGTLKRRLHKGRQRLHDVAEKIMKGIRPMNPHREQILQRLRDLVDKGPNSMNSLQILQQVSQLRPLPRELLAKFLQRHSNTSKRMAAPKGREEVEHRSRKVMEFFGRPSERALDPDHVVGKVADAIRAALPEFKEWHVDVSRAAQSLVQVLSGNIDSVKRPPGFAEGSPGSYIYTARGGLFQSRDGSMCTMYELMQNEDTEQAHSMGFASRGRISDMLILTWMRSETIELWAVEELLQRLCDVVVPDTPIKFRSFEDPGHRAALRMQLGDIPIPAAMGGPLNPWPNMPEGVNAACVQIFLEPWATAQSGQVVELADIPPLFFEDNKRQL